MPVICGADTLDNPSTTSSFGAIWVPAGARVGFSASGEIMPSLYFGNGRGEYQMFWRVYDGTSAIAQGWGFAFTDINWGPGPYTWNPFSDKVLGEWTNNTGATRTFGIETWAVRSYAGAGIHYSVDFAVDGGVYGYCNQRVSGSEFFGPNPAMGQQCPPCHGGTSNTVDTFTGNEHFALPGISIEGRGPGLDFQLAHNSLDAGYDGPFGRGWRSTYDMAIGKDPDGSRTVFQETGATVTFAPGAGGTWVAPGAFTATLTQNPDGTWRFVRNRVEVFTFDTAGRLSAIADLNGYATSLTYANDMLDYVEDSAGRRLDFSSSGGRVRSITDPLAAPLSPRVLGFDYGNGDMIAFQDVGGRRWTLDYDAHRLAYVRQPGHVDPTAWRFHYDSGGRVDWEEDPLGRRTEIRYGDPAAGSTRVIDPAGDSRVDTYDPIGRRTSVTSGWGTPEATTTQFAYNPNTSMVTSVIDGANHQWQQAYGDPANPLRATRRIDPLGRTTDMTYNSLGLRTSFTDGEGILTTTDYDPAGNVELITQAVGTPDQAVTDLVYGDSAHPGDLTGVIDPRAKTWTFAYNPLTGDRTSATNPEGETTTWAYNNIGWVTQTVPPEGNRAGAVPTDHDTIIEYDRYGAPLRVTDALGRQTAMSYDANGNLTFTSDPDGDLTGRTWTAAHQLATVTEGANSSAATTTYAYWPDGQLRTWSTGPGTTRTTDYDALGRLASSTDPLGNVTSYRYDANGNLTQLTQPGGNCGAPTPTGCIGYTYDNANQLTGVDYSDAATPDVTAMTYDLDGRRRTETLAGAGTSTSTWTRRGQLASHTDAAGLATTYTYDPGDNLTQLLYPGQTQPLVYGYDGAGRTISATDWVGNQSSFDYDTNSNLTDIAYPTSIADRLTYDRADRLDTLTWGRNGTTSLGSLDYGRDPEGLITTATPTGLPAGPTSFTYDTRDQLATAGGGQYAYDSASNLVRTPGAFNVFDGAGQLQESDRAISVVGVAKTADTVATSVSLTLPAGIAANDQILLAVTLPDDQAVTTPPAGYTLLAQPEVSGSGRTMVYRRSAAGGETSVTVGFNGSGLYAKALMAAVYRGVDPLAPIAGVTTGTGTGTVTVPGITITRPGTRLALVAGLTGNLFPDSFEQPTGMTEQVAVYDQLLIAAAIGDQVLPTAGPTGQRTATFAQNRGLVGVLVAFNPETHSFDYDPRGNRTGRTTPYATTTYAYDQANRLTAVDATGDYRYDGNGLRTQATLAGQKTHFGWDRAGGLPMLLTETPVRPDGSLDVAATASYIYGPGGRTLGRLEPRPAISLVGTGTVSNLGVGNSITLNLPAGIVKDDQIVLAVTHSNQTTPTIPAGYTEIGTWVGTSTTERLWRRTATGGETSLTIGFSGGLAAPRAAVASVYRGVDPTNPIMASAGAVAQGTVLTIPSLTPTGGANELVAFAGATQTLGGTTWTTPAGMTTRANTAQATISATAADQPISGTTPTGARTFGYATSTSLAGAAVILRQAPPPQRWYHSDGIGSTRIISNKEGQKVGTATYDPYGQPLATTGETSRLGYAGQYTDPGTGLIYLRARYYDPAYGQFLTRDPAEALTQEPYSYAGNDPINRIDPTGEVPLLAVVAVGALIGAVSDIGIQALGNLAQGCGAFDSISWGSVAFSAALGGLGAGAASRIARAPRATGIRSPVVRPDLGNLSSKIQRQMGTRGWTPDLIDEAVQQGRAFPAVNKLGGANTQATRYVHPGTGQSVVIDNATGQVVQVGGPGFRY